MRAALLVPRRAGNRDRDRLWALARGRWAAQHPELTVYEGHHDVGPFNRAAALNRAAELADQDGPWHVALVIDADIFLPAAQVRRAIARAATTGRVTWAFQRWRGLTEAATTRLLTEPDYGEQLLGPGGFDAWDAGEAARAAAIAEALEAGGSRAQIRARLLDALAAIPRGPIDTAIERTTPVSWSCAIAIPRPAWDRLGGFDERYRGWGWEDMALQSAACSLIGHERIEGDVYHLWHPRAPGLGSAGRAATGLTADAIRNARLGRRYMVAARRDYGVHDRLEPSTPEELERDIANLKHDDAQLAPQAARAGLPDWSSWWPTLEELIEGAQEERRAGRAWHRAPAQRAARRPSPTPRTTAPPSVTIAVHTDGRRDYIARALPSLIEKVRGPIVQRVIFDDSGDPDYKAWLAATFGPADFYVVGPAERLGYTGSMQALWSYLRRRARGRFVFQAEDDFTYRRPVDLAAMAEILDAQAHLRQLALLRAPYYPPELEAGSIIAQRPDAYRPAGDGNGRSWLEHREHFTANPSLFRRELTEIPWPTGRSSERLYTQALNRDPRSRFAYLGHGEPWIDHIGAERAGTGY